MQTWALEQNEYALHAFFNILTTLALVCLMGVQSSIRRAARNKIEAPAPGFAKITQIRRAPLIDKSEPHESPMSASRRAVLGTLAIGVVAAPTLAVEPRGQSKRQPHGSSRNKVGALQVSTPSDLIVEHSVWQDPGLCSQWHSNLPGYAIRSLDRRGWALHASGEADPLDRGI